MTVYSECFQPQPRMCWVGRRAGAEQLMVLQPRLLPAFGAAVRLPATALAVQPRDGVLALRDELRGGKDFWEDQRGAGASYPSHAVRAGEAGLRHALHKDRRLTPQGRPGGDVLLGEHPLVPLPDQAHFHVGVAFESRLPGHGP